MTASMRRRFYFSLRTLFVLVTILGVFLGWVGAQLKWIHDRQEALRWIVDYRARQLAAESGHAVPPEKGVVHAGRAAPWSLRILGESGIARLEIDQDWLRPEARYTLDELGLLFPEAEVTAVSPPARKEWSIGTDAEAKSSAAN